MAGCFRSPVCASVAALWSGPTAAKSKKKQQQEDKLQRILQEIVAAEEISVDAAAVLSERDGGAHIKRS